MRSVLRIIACILAPPAFIIGACAVPVVYRLLNVSPTIEACLQIAFIIAMWLLLSFFVWALWVSE